MKRFISIYRKIFHLDVLRKLGKEIDEKDSVLDLGCGWNSLIQYCKPGYSLGVDSYDRYIEVSQNKRIHTEYKQGDISDIEFEPRSFDIVLCAQVIEHFSKDEACRVMEKMEKWARRKVIITTPNGFLEKPSYDENEHQEHLSGWTVDELKERGYKVWGSSGLKIIRQKCKPKIYWRIVFNVSSIITRYIPRHAFQLFAVKDITGSCK